MYTSSLDHTVSVYQAFPSLVRAIIADSEDIEECFKDMHSCYSSAAYPSGIAPWKLFSFSFWPGREHPLGLRWQLSPEDYSALGQGETTYLGYSIEDTCAQYPIVPHEKRKNDAYVLAKLLTFFTVRRDRAWAPEVMDAATHATGVRYVLGAINDTDEGDWGIVELPKEYVNLGEIGQDAFLQSLRHAKVLVGMGNPMTFVHYLLTLHSFDLITRMTDPQRLMMRSAWAYPSSIQSVM